MLFRFFGCGAGAVYSKQMPQHLFRAALKTDVHSAELGLIHDIARRTYSRFYLQLSARPSFRTSPSAETAVLERKQQPTTIWRGGNCGYSFGDLGENPGVAARKLSKLSLDVPILQDGNRRNYAAIQGVPGITTMMAK
jgi:hypothetical protein